MNILTSQTVDKGNTPKDILMIRKLIEGEGIEEYEKNTLNFVSEYISSYIADILNESKHYALYAERHKINIEDVKLAVKLKQNTFYSKRPDTNALKEIAKEVNSLPLSNIPDTPLILLPPPEHSLTRNNFQIFSEEILHNLTTNKSEIAEHKLEEEILGKRHSMIGLKRRDYDDRPNLVIKKKMKVSQHSDEAYSQMKSVSVQQSEDYYKGEKHYRKESKDYAETINKHYTNDNYHGKTNVAYHSHQLSVNNNLGKHHRTNTPKEMEEEDLEDNLFNNDGEEDSLMHRGDNFLNNENSEMDEFNYDNTFS